MKLDEEIQVAKYEKNLDTRATELLGFLKSETALTEAQIINLAYSPEAEMLKNYDYFGAINEMAREKIYDPKKLVEFRVEISDALPLIESSDYHDIELGYGILAEAYVLCEGSTALRRSHSEETYDHLRDLLLGRGISRIKDKKKRDAAVAAVKAGRPEVARNEFVGDRKYDQAINSVYKKLGSMDKKKHNEK